MQGNHQPKQKISTQKKSDTFALNLRFCHAILCKSLFLFGDQYFIATFLPDFTHEDFFRKSVFFTYR